jgi:hypothetical protein
MRIADILRLDADWCRRTMIGSPDLQPWQGDSFSGCGIFR